MAISLVAQGSIDLKPLVTHHFDFEDAAEAFEVARLGKDKDGKVSGTVLDTYSTRHLAVIKTEATEANTRFVATAGDQMHHSRSRIVES